MKRPIFSRRDVLKGSTAIAASGAFASVTSSGAAGERGDAGADRGGQEEGRVVYYTSIDLPVAERLAKRSRQNIPARRGGGAHRRRARVPAYRQEYASRHLFCRRRSTRPTPPTHRVETRRTARAHVPEDVAKYTRRAQRSRRHLRELSRLGLRDRLQHHMSKPRRRPKSYFRPARSEMDEQDRQAHRATAAPIMTATYQMRATSLGTIREACQAKGDAGAVVGRPAEETFAGERRGHGGWQRVQQFIERRRKPGRDRSMRRRLAAHRRPNALFKNAPIRTPPAVPELLLSRPRPQQLRLISQACVRCIRRPGRKPGRKPFSEIKKMKDDPARWRR